MIEADIGRLLAERACERLVYQYARFVDTGEAARVADLFTPDGMWIGADGRSMVGQEEVRAAFASRQGLTRRLSRHVITNVLIDVGDASRASGTAYLINFRHDSRDGTADKPGPARHPKFVGDYHFEFLRAGDQWHISRLQFDLVFLRRAEPPAPRVAPEADGDE